jgi:hypothetical protein
MNFNFVCGFSFLLVQVVTLFDFGCEDLINMQLFFNHFRILCFFPCMSNSFPILIRMWIASRASVN